MNKLLILLLTLTITGWVSSLHVIGSSGGEVRIECEFRWHKDDHSKKYFCRVNPYDVRECETLIMGVKKSGRYTLKDTLFGKVQVTIRDLTKEDEGKYRCEFYGKSDSRTEVTLSVKDVPGQRSIELTGLIGEDVSITCFFPPEQKDGDTSVRMELCKSCDTMDCCFDVVELGNYETSNTKDRWSISHNETDNFYTVTLSNRTVRDSGIYWCSERVHGFNKPNKGIYQSYSTKVLLTMQGWLASFPVIGSLGGSVRIQCDLPANKIHKPMYVCKGTEGNCTIVFRTEAKTLRPGVHYRNAQLVVMTDLKKEEEGNYVCGVEEESGPNTYSEFQLTVKDVPNQQGSGWTWESLFSGPGSHSIKLTAPGGGNVSITGFYPAEHRDSKKFLCRGGEVTLNSECETQVSLKPDETFHKSGKFSMTDNSTENFATVTIDNLAWYRSGSYWFGVSRFENGGRYSSYITPVELTVKGGEGEKGPLGGAGGLGGLLGMFGVDVGQAFSQLDDVLEGKN